MCSLLQEEALRFLCPFRVDVIDDDDGALFCKALGDAAANASSCAGHNRNSVLESHHFLHKPSAFNRRSLLPELAHRDHGNARQDQRQAGPQ
ncbi:MAG: hypothetical protein ACREIC_03700, partial [Limisphaerales bacterium]